MNEHSTKGGNKMKKVQKSVLMCLLFVGLLGFGATQPALAAGTASGTVITNNATLEYQVGGVPQTSILDVSPPQFVVDNKVDLVVAEDTGSSGYTDVNPNTLNQVLTFTVSNTGNTVQDFALVAAPGTDPHGGADNFDASALRIYLEEGTTPGFQLAEDTLATYIDELAPWNAAGDEVTVYVVANIAITQASGDIAAYTLTATARAGGAASSEGAALTQTVGANTPGVDIVFADGAGDTDGARDAAFSDSDAYQVLSAQLTIDKSSTVIRDPFNLATNPKQIPGAYVQYAITITNAGGATASATLTSITDTLDANTAIDPDLIVAATGAPESASGSGFKVDWSGSGGRAGFPKYYTTTSSVDGVDIAAGVITATMATILPLEGAYTVPGELLAGESVTLTFNVIIQ